MTRHRACRGCLDGCTPDTPRHCASCIHEPWPCEAYEIGQHLMRVAADVHRLRQHPPYGSSFLDCEIAPCPNSRIVLGLPLHGYEARLAAEVP